MGIDLPIRGSGRHRLEHSGRPAPTTWVGGRNSRRGDISPVAVDVGAVRRTLDSGDIGSGTSCCSSRLSTAGSQ